jgi:hypothetical protein
VAITGFAAERRHRTSVREAAEQRQIDIGVYARDDLIGFTNGRPGAGSAGVLPS